MSFHMLMIELHSRPCMVRANCELMGTYLGGRDYLHLPGCEVGDFYRVVRERRWGPDRRDHAELYHKWIDISDISALVLEQNDHVP